MSIYELDWFADWPTTLTSQSTACPPTPTPVIGDRRTGLDTQMIGYFNLWVFYDSVFK